MDRFGFGDNVRGDTVPFAWAEAGVPDGLEIFNPLQLFACDMGIDDDDFTGLTLDSESDRSFCTAHGDCVPLKTDENQLKPSVWVEIVK